MKNSKIGIICRNAIIAAVYVALSYISFPFSFGPIQVRIAEALVLLCFFNKSYIVGVTIGCLISNIYSALTLTPLDLIIGTLATLLSCVFTSIFRHLFLSTICTSLINALFVGFELTFFMESANSFWFNFGFVLLGEAIATCVLGYIIIRIFGKKKFFQDLILANQNQTFVW